MSTDQLHQGPLDWDRVVHVARLAADEGLANRKLPLFNVVSPRLPQHLREVAGSLGRGSFGNEQRVHLMQAILGGFSGVGAVYMGLTHGLPILMGVLALVSLGFAGVGVFQWVRSASRLRSLAKDFPGRTAYSTHSFLGRVSAKSLGRLVPTDAAESALAISILVLLGNLRSQVLSTIESVPPHLTQSLHEVLSEEAWREVSWEVACDLEIIQAAEGEVLASDVEEGVDASRQRVVAAYQNLLDLLEEAQALSAVVAASETVAASKVRTLLEERLPSQPESDNVEKVRSLREAYREATSQSEDRLR